MGTKISAGLLMYREQEQGPELYLAHPGGPFFRDKDDHHWTIPKGGVAEGEELLTAACREFEEETGICSVPPYIPLGWIKQSAKTVHAWAFHAPEVLPPFVTSFFELEYPPHSGKFASFPEIDRVAFFSIEDAKRKILEAQKPLIDRLVDHLRSSHGH